MQKLIIDPPEGWRYGFPRIFDIKKNQSIEDWLREKGYPQSLINTDTHKRCRYWHEETNDKKEFNLNQKILCTFGFHKRIPVINCGWPCNQCEYCFKYMGD